MQPHWDADVAPYMTAVEEIIELTNTVRAHTVLRLAPDDRLQCICSPSSSHRQEAQLGTCCREVVIGDSSAEALFLLVCHQPQGGHMLVGSLQLGRYHRLQQHTKVPSVGTLAITCCSKMTLLVTTVSTMTSSHRDGHPPGAAHPDA